MAELNTASAAQGAGGRVRRKKTSTRVDLTAMVDLAFLLITFFILTTTLQKPKAMSLTMPDNSVPNHDTPYPESRTMTILLGAHNKVEWYMGLPSHPLVAPSVTGFGKAGIMAALLDENARIKQATGKDMLVIIKASDKAKYGNVVNLMDYLNIMDNQQRALVDITPGEVQLLKRDKIYD